jgi:hypothetical protein
MATESTREKDSGIARMARPGHGWSGSGVLGGAGILNLRERS